MRKLDLPHISKAKRTWLKDMTVVTYLCEATEIIKENTVPGQTSGADARHRTRAGGTLAAHIN